MEHGPPPTWLSDFLRQYRHEHGMTVQDLALRCQMPMATLMALEHGDRPQPEDLEALAHGLEMPLSTIRRASLGEAVLEPLPQEDAVENRSSTLLEAIQGLTPSQIERAKEYIRFLRWSDRQPPED